MVATWFSERQLERVLHLRPRQLAGWQRRGLFPRQERYGWQEIVRARALRQYEATSRSASGAIGKLARSLDAARGHAGELTDPLRDARIEVHHGRVELRFAGVRMDALSGQLGFAFPPDDTVPRECKAPGPDRRHAEAEQWFAFALSLDGEPELRPQVAGAYERCLELDPNFTSARINLGTLRYHEKDFAAAETWYRSACELDPSYALAYFNLGNVLDETGRLQEAVDAYSTALRLVPGYADAHYNLALAYQRMGQPRRAVPHWQQYLGLDRQSPFADHARLQLKQALAREGLRVIARGAAS